MELVNEFYYYKPEQANNSIDEYFKGPIKKPIPFHSQCTSLLYICCSINNNNQYNSLYSSIKNEKLNANINIRERTETLLFDYFMPRSSFMIIYMNNRSIHIYTRDIEESYRTKPLEMYFIVLKNHL